MINFYFFDGQTKPGYPDIIEEQVGEMGFERCEWYNFKTLMAWRKDGGRGSIYVACEVPEWFERTPSTAPVVIQALDVDHMERGELMSLINRIAGRGFTDVEVEWRYRDKGREHKEIIFD